jgi:hypothetical protein
MRFSCRRATYLTVQAMGLLGTTAVAEPVALEKMALASSQWPIRGTMDWATSMPASFDDEAGQVQLVVDARVVATGKGAVTTIMSISFQIMTWAKV